LRYALRYRHRVLRLHLVPRSRQFVDLTDKTLVEALDDAQLSILNIRCAVCDGRLTAYLLRCPRKCTI
jgi:hypothetical protein